MKKHVVGLGGGFDVAIEIMRTHREKKNKSFIVDGIVPLKFRCY